MLNTSPNPQRTMLLEGMREEDQQRNHMFSYLSPEERVQKDHPLRAIWGLVWVYPHEHSAPMRSQIAVYVDVQLFHQPFRNIAAVAIMFTPNPQLN